MMTSAVFRSVIPQSEGSAPLSGIQVYFENRLILIVPVCAESKLKRIACLSSHHEP